MTAADVGAGDGDWLEALAAAVAPNGRLFATEVAQEKVDEVVQRVEERGLENVTVVLGNQTQSGLPEGCCNAILLRMVYHHFENPPAMRASLLRALQPDGRLVIVDIRPQHHWRSLESVPERGGHGIEPADLIEEMIAAGLELISRHDDWNGDDDRYCLVFRRPSALP